MATPSIGDVRSAPIRDGVDTVRPDDMPRLVETWEASVRATHDFLAEADIERFKPVVRDDLFDALPLFCVRDRDGALVAFSGVTEGRLEALFVHPEFRGTGIGRRLVRHAVDELGATTVDVNEQNEQAVGFYHRMGFEVAERSDLDEHGLPYPLLHMRLKNPGGRVTSARRRRAGSRPGRAR
jgi:putative acetyltransferase